MENRIIIFLCVLMRQRTDKLPIVKSLQSEVHSYKLLKWFAGIFRSRFKTVLIQDVLKCTAMCTAFRHFKRPQCLEISQWVKKNPKEHFHKIVKKTGNHMNYMHLFEQLSLKLQGRIILGGVSVFCTFKIFALQVSVCFTMQFMVLN